MRDQSQLPLLSPKPFAIAKVKGRYVDRAARYSLSSLIHRVHSDREIAHRINHVSTRWATFVHAMDRLGWRFSEKRGPWKIGRCHPATVWLVDEKLHGCHLEYLCPFCWARSTAYPVFRRFSRALFAEDRVPAGYTSPFHLMEVHTWRLFDAAIAPVEAVILDAADFRDRYLHKVFGRSPLGAFWCQSIEPAYYDPEQRRLIRNVWSHHHRILAVVGPEMGQPPGYVKRIDKETKTIRRIVRHTDVTKLKLVRAVGRVTQYPHHLLNPEFLPRTLEFLAARKRVAGWKGIGRSIIVRHASYGALRGEGKVLSIPA